VIDNKLFYQKS